MAEKYISPEAFSFAEPPVSAPGDEECVVIHVDFRPAPDRQEILHRIGAIATSYRQPDDSGPTLSCDPISLLEYDDGTIDAKFKLYQQGHASDSAGMGHQGWSGSETIRILNVTWDAEAGMIHSGYVHARNFRYQLLPLESKKHSDIAKAEAEIQDMRDAIWNTTPAVEAY